MDANNLTIGRLAHSAGVGVETVRYYQRRQLLPLPVAQNSAFRTYPAALADRIRFIKRAQELGFSLDEIEALLQLEDGSDRAAIRELATEKLLHIRAKMADLARMESALNHLIHECAATGQAQPCPIIAALAGASAAPCPSLERAAEIYGRSRDI
ncbi:MAG: MerR family DNA-binding protein [Oxalobacteraceae bacterium]